MKPIIYDLGTLDHHVGLDLAPDGVVRRVVYLEKSGPAFGPRPYLRAVSLDHAIVSLRAMVDAEVDR